MKQTSLKQFSGYNPGSPGLSASGNSSIRQISQIKDRIYLEYSAAVQQNNDLKYPFFHELDKLMAEWSKLEGYMEHDIAFEYFLKPLQRLCRQRHADHNAYLLLNLSNDCIYALNNLTALKSFIKDSVDFKLEMLQSIATNLDSFQKKFWP